MGTWKRFIHKKKLSLKWQRNVWYNEYSEKIRNVVVALVSSKVKARFSIWQDEMQVYL